ncbi:hypothetical protein EW15_2042 [Prochlorococcus sp. MIT 0801]|nr:hypothetical protein EW15_2042 [Prochlorococcus sp. MIT 0801]
MQGIYGTLTESLGLPDLLIPYWQHFFLFLGLIWTCPNQLRTEREDF